MKNQYLGYLNFGLLMMLAIVTIACGIPSETFGIEAMAIPAVDHRGVYTKTLVEFFNEKPVATSFLRSFFPSKTTMSREISIEVIRGTEKVAVDVLRGTNGNYNKFDKSSEKIFLPPFFDEWFALNELDLYDEVMANPSARLTAKLVETQADKMEKLRNKILRAYENQCAQALTSGIITLVSGDNIDFKRKSGSMVDLGAGNYWADTDIDPTTSIVAGCQFLRKEGKIQGGIVNMICGSTAISHFLNNTAIQNKAEKYSMKLTDLNMARQNAVGGVYHGRFSMDSYLVDVWSYPEFYENSAGTLVPYIDDKDAILIPEKPNFNLSFGAVPQLQQNGGFPQRGEFLVQDFVDFRQTVHEMHIKSAGVSIPVGVDQIYTIQAVAS